MNCVEYPKIYIIILNWNAWKATAECLESVYRSDYPNFKVIVCDNNSQDSSVEYLKAWADGELDLWLPNENPLRRLSYPPISKPIRYIEYQREYVETASNFEDAHVDLILLQAGSNLGFAGGNNVGARYAQKNGKFGYIWFLNNDTVVEPDALSQLVQRMNEKPNAGICGSVLHYYTEPTKVQSFGGAKYNKFTSTCDHIRRLPEINQPTDTEAIESMMDYIVGASMLVTNSLLREVGLMNEDYFLFFEELDWAVRARARNFSLAFAKKSIVYHKGGESTGSSDDAASFSYSADYWINRSRLLFVKKYYPALIPLLYLRFFTAILNRFKRKQYDRIPMILGLLVNNNKNSPHLP